MDDLTIVYYTDGSLAPASAAAGRRHLSESSARAGAYSLISVSQKPLSFGRNICVGPQPRAFRTIVHQIVTGLAAATTEYVALCEHDTFYPPSHFDLRPPADYDLVVNQHRHRAFPRDGRFCLFRGGRSMQLIVGRRVVLLSDLAGKLKLLVADRDWHKRFEPGCGEADLNLPPVRCHIGASAEPIIDIVNHGGNYSGRKRLGELSTDRLPDGRTMTDLIRAWSLPGPATKEERA